MGRKNTLHELHAKAGALASAALDVFRSVADDLDRAALAHQSVATDAQEQIDQHAALRDAAQAAADAATRQAEAVRGLVS